MQLLSKEHHHVSMIIKQTRQKQSHWKEVIVAMKLKDETRLNILD